MILAGGKSSRIGIDKGLVKLDGRLTIIERIIHRLENLFDEILIVTNNRFLYEGFQAVVVEDLVESKGPLGGIFSGLSSSANDLNFVVGCDMPFINPDLVAYLVGKPQDYDVVIPEINSQLETLFARYSKRTLPFIASQLERGELRVLNILKNLQVLRIASHEIARFDPDHLSFFNINSPQDLERARTIQA
jgi:molybdopterin-guanine dinucleotide biosynthesis protein A